MANEYLNNNLRSNNASSAGTALPHVQNVQAAIKHWDPLHSAIFEVYIATPGGLVGTDIAGDFTLLTQQVTQVSGLDALNKVAGAGQQKFFGVDVSYQNPTLDNTYCEFTIEFNLNIRNKADVWAFRLFKEWSRLGYDKSDGARTLKADYISNEVTINEANRDGTIWRSVSFRNVLLIDVTGLDSLNYTSNDARTLTCKFRADYWYEQISTGEGVTADYGYKD